MVQISRQKAIDSISCAGATIPPRLLCESLMRVRASKSFEQLFYRDELARGIKALGVTTWLDGYGNLIADNTTIVAGNKTLHATNLPMFTSHLDTVTKDIGAGSELVQSITYEQKDGDLFLRLHDDEKGKGYVLGADCGAGIYVMLEMLRHNVPGLYCFFLDEEIGGLGSRWLAQNYKTDCPIIANVTHCISFDRAGTTDIITHQYGGRCCSDEFATYLAKELASVELKKYGKPPTAYKKLMLEGEELSDAPPRLHLQDLQPDPTGSFTDSANFTSIVAECTNISVGYYNQHTERESQNVSYLLRLVEVLAEIDWQNLPRHREPNDARHPSDRSIQYDFDYLIDDYQDDYAADMWQEIDNLRSGGMSYAQELVYNNPEYAAELLTTIADEI